MAAVVASIARCGSIVAVHPTSGVVAESIGRPGTVLAAAVEEAVAEWVASTDASRRSKTALTSAITGSRPCSRATSSSANSSRHPRVLDVASPRHNRGATRAIAAPTPGRGAVLRAVGM